MKNGKIKNTAVSLIFVVFVSAAMSFFAYYASAPVNSRPDIKKYSGGTEAAETENQPAVMPPAEKTASGMNNADYSSTSSEYSQDEPVSAPDLLSVSYNSAYTGSSSVQNSGNAYDRLLDELADNAPQSGYAVNYIINKLSAFKGYPENIIKITIKDIDETGAKSIDSSMLANFNFFTGEMTVSRKMVYKLDIKTMIAVLAHELDHFDKIARVCKSLGIDKFSRLYTDNGRFGLNSAFWNQASPYADINSFDAQLYTNGLIRFLTQYKLEHTSSYSDFYRLAENMRNPLEVSGYKESDYVFNHFGMAAPENAMKKTADIFDEADRALDGLISGKPELENEKPALFDYFFAKSIIKILPEYAQTFYRCEADGNLTAFWLEFEKRFSDFYNNGRMSEWSKNTLIDISALTADSIRAGMTPEETAKALEYKMNTLKNNLVYDGAVMHLRRTAADYLETVKKNGIQNPAQELEALLILICIDNKFYKSNFYSRISLNNIYLPPEAVKLCSAENSCTDYRFIYNNPAFQERTADMSKDDAGKFIELLNKTRLDVKSGR